MIPAAMLCGACSQGIGPVVPQSEVERKMIGLLEKFDRWDENGDGKLDESELSEGLAGSEHTAEGVIDFYDSNGDHMVSLREAQAGYRRAAEAEQLDKAVKAARAAAR
jgi:hypothetical protein